MSGRNQRKLFKTARLSRDYHLHILIGGLAFVGVLFGFSYLKVTEIQQLVASLPDQQMAGELSQRITLITTISFLSIFVFTALVSAYLLIVTHRVAGPVVAISRYIRDIREGRYDVNRALRENDELGPIMDELRELTKTLAARK